MNPKGAAIHRLADARRRGDFEAVRAILTDDVVWHEPGEADYSGDTVGADAVIALMRRLAEATGGTFVFEPQPIVTSDEHAAASTRWSAEREGVRCEGSEASSRY